ncbi:hypothetical protein BaRGS_00024243, partial [Batillaria attramentaria]
MFVRDYRHVFWWQKQEQGILSDTHLTCKPGKNAETRQCVFVVHCPGLPCICTDCYSGSACNDEYLRATCESQTAVNLARADFRLSPTISPQL